MPGIKTVICGHCGRETPVKPPIEITASNILLVEGEDECAFIDKLVDSQFPGERMGFDLFAVGGKDRFSAAMNGLTPRTDFMQVKTVAIIRDADKDWRAAFHKIQSVIQSINNNNPDRRFPIPKNPDSFANLGNRRIGVFIMPGGKRNGMLEDLVLESVVRHDIFPCIRSYLDCLAGTLKKKRIDDPDDNQFRYFPKNEPKAYAKALLAAAHEDVYSVGLAAQKGCFDFSHPCFKPLIKFLGEFVASE